MTLRTRLVLTTALLLTVLLALPTYVAAYNVRTELGYQQYRRVADAIPYSSSQLFLALSSGVNASISSYTIGSGGKLNMIVENKQGGGCIPNFNDPPSPRVPCRPYEYSLHRSFPKLLIADRVPSNRIFEVSRNDSVPLSQNREANTYATVAGAPCSFSEQSFAERDEGVPSNSSMTTPQSMVFDPVTGNLYFSLKYSVGVLYPNGTMNYFGSDNRRGSRSDLWNKEEQHRKNATTLYPLQLALDTVSRVLYVAEQGYSTVRAISLINDSATIVLGMLEGSYVWPPPECYPEACKASDVNLLYVASLGLVSPYHSQRALVVRW